MMIGANGQPAPARPILMGLNGELVPMMLGPNGHPMMTGPNGMPFIMQNLQQEDKQEVIKI